MNKYDAIVIGGGVLGCFVLRSLRRYNITCLLLEAEDDVCRKITKANTAIVYTGSDNRPGSLKAEMTVRANRNFHILCKELDVDFSRCGSLMVAFGEKADEVIKKKLIQAEANGVEGVRIVTGKEARKIEPTLSEDVTSALYSPMTGTVNPWQLGIAAYENALSNGAEALMNSKVTGIEKSADGYIVKTAGHEFHTKMIFNCAGLQADKVSEYIFEEDVYLQIDGADFLVFDRNAQKPTHIIFHETEDGKGITAVPTTEGNLLADSPPREGKDNFATTLEGIKYIKDSLNKILPAVDTSKVIRSFGALRPNPHKKDGRSIHSFCIENPQKGFYSLIGIKTPGLTCADELGKYLADKGAEYLNADINTDFDPVRKRISEKDGEIICLCEKISKGEIIEAIKRGARTIDGIKMRVGATMGKCQGARCSFMIEKILEEYNDETL